MRSKVFGRRYDARNKILRLHGGMDHVRSQSVCFGADEFDMLMWNALITGLQFLKDHEC